MANQPDPVPNPHAPRYADLRVAYDLGSLDAADLQPEPLTQFRAWFAAAEDSGLAEPNAMVLGTAGEDGPSARTVLLKAADGRGFVFYTNYGSRKAAAIAADPRVSLLFPWYALHRQVAVRGTAARVDAAETAAYFSARPWASRIGAWASEQSRTLPDRGPLERRFEELAARWPDHGDPADVPVPPHWGGFVVTATEVEFWQGRASRLHDRLVYVAAEAGAALDAPGAWRVERRQP